MRRKLPTVPAFAALRTFGHGALAAARRYLELGTIGLLLLISGCLWIFAELADEASEGSTREFDTAVLLAFRDPADPSDPLGPTWLEEFGRDVTALGGLGLLAVITLAVAGFLWLRDRRGTAILILLAIGSGQLMSFVFKLGFDRSRPELVPHRMATYTSSFPSGHAMMAAVTYLTLAVLLARVQEGRRIKIYILSVAVIITVAVGISRIYLGVHWPTDVLAGWTAGAAWAFGCLLVANWLHRLGLIGGRGRD